MFQPLVAVKDLGYSDGEISAFLSAAIIAEDSL